MSRPDAYTQWQRYTAAEIDRVRPILGELGFALEDEQPHIGGERYLQQAVTTTSGYKLILLGRRMRDNTRVVIKCSSNPDGRTELRHERRCRQTLAHLQFAHAAFHFPPELAWQERNRLLVAVYAYIEQPQAFLERPLAEQFELAHHAFTTQEAARATTARHFKTVSRVFGHRDADTYLHHFTYFLERIQAHLPAELRDDATLAAADRLLQHHRTEIARYGDFLTHVDFVPHNIRVDAERTLYLLDASSFRFGNKYEGWARFCNFMALHHPDLEAALVRYVVDNRFPGEVTALRVMRVYRLAEIVWFYTQTLPNTSDNLHTLNTKRVQLWQAIMHALVHDAPMPHEAIAQYRRERDALRSEEEQRRQQGLH